MKTSTLNGTRWAIALGVALAGAAQAAEVAAKTLRVTLAEDRLGTVTRLVTASGHVLSPEKVHSPLFKLTFVRTDDFSKQKEVVSGKAASFRVEQDGAGVRLVYGDLGEACAGAVCTVRGEGDNVRWGISVTAKPGWALEETEYPRIRLSTGLVQGTNDVRYVYGTAKGGVYYPARRSGGWQLAGVQPGPLAAAFACLYDGRAGFYYAAEDGAGVAKRLGARGDKSGVDFISSRLGFDPGRSVQGYDVVTGGFEGTEDEPCTWHDAADRYRAWAETQRWCAKKFRDRTDVPAWMKDAPAMVRFCRDALEDPDEIRRWMRDYWLKEFPAAPLVMAYWGWEKLGNWVTPDYFPVTCGDAAFTRLVSDMKKVNGHAFPWPSGYHWTLTYVQREDGSFQWDDRERFDRTALPHAVFTREGRRYNRTPSWLRGGSTACMCGGDPWTRDWWNNDICRPLAKMGCEMIQVDQVVGGAFPPCWAPGHPHAPNAGQWKTDAFRAQLETMYATMKSCQPDVVVCYEEPCETFNDFAGIQDYRDCESRADEWASVFNYLYHDYVPCFQSNPRRGNRVWQAHEVADGQVPFLSPTRQDGMPAVPSLVNGDFEKVSVDGTQFPGWEKLSGYNGRKWSGTMAVDAETVHGGKHAIRLEVKPGENAVQVSQNVRVDGMAFGGEGHRFRLSAWLKSGRHKVPNTLNYCFLGGGKGGGSLPFPKPEEGWVKVARDFTVPAGAELLRIMMHLNGDALAWVDDLKLEEVKADGTAQEVFADRWGAYDAFMRRWVELYHGEGRAWLADGRQVKPPQVVCGRQPYTMSFHGGSTVKCEQPTAFCQSYVAKDGRRATVVVNATATPQDVTLVEKGQRTKLTLAPDEIRLLRH